MRRSPSVLFLEPFILLAVGLASLLFMMSAKLRRARRNAGTKELLALQGCSVPCLIVAVVMPSIGPAAMLCFFMISLVVIMRMQRDGL